MNTVATTRIIPETIPVYADEEVAHAQLPSVAMRIRALLVEQGPVTVWEVADKLEASYINQISAVLDKLNTEGNLARFRAGFNDYYALPRVALVGKEPTLRTIISDSLKGLFIGCRYEVMRKFKGTNKYPPSK